MISEENVKKILNNYVLCEIPCVILVKVVAELDKMGALKEEEWRCSDE